MKKVGRWVNEKVKNEVRKAQAVVGRQNTN
jgi:hypothetical protein